MKESIIQKIPAKTLEWGNASEKKLTWKEAKEWCEQQGDGWRMPTRLELLQAYEDNVDGFKTDGYYWSSTEGNASNAWGVVFISGGASSTNETGAGYVRCVK